MLQWRLGVVLIPHTQRDPACTGQARAAFIESCTAHSAFVGFQNREEERIPEMGPKVTRVHFLELEGNEAGLVILPVGYI